MRVTRSLGRLVRVGLCAAALAAATVDRPASAMPARPIRFTRLSLEQGLSQSTVLCMFQDSRGYIWLGTEDGLNRFDGIKFTVYKNDPADASSLPSNFVWAIDEDAQGNLWIATDGEGLVKWDRTLNRFVRRADISSRYIRTLRFGPDGALWIGTRDAGLDRLDVTTGKLTHFGQNPDDPGSLSDNRIYVLHVDTRGRLWVGTDAGLNLLDAERGTFARFLHDPQNPSSLSQDRIRSVYADDSGIVWVGTHGSGLNRLDPATGRSEHFQRDPRDPDSLANDQVRAIFRDRGGRLWVGTTGGLDLFDAERRRFVHYQHDDSPTTLGDNAIMTIGQDRSGLLWVGTRLGGVHNWNPLSWQFGHVAPDLKGPDGLASGNVTAFAEDPGGRLWVGTFGGGLHVMNRVTGRMTRYLNKPNDDASLSSDRVTALVYSHEGAMWVGTLDGGLSRFDPDLRTFARFRHNPSRGDSLGADGVMTMFEDDRGTLWIGTFGEGLDRFDRATGIFEHFRHVPDDPASLSGDRITSIAGAVDGRLWVGTDGGGLNLFDPRSGKSRRYLHEQNRRDSLPSDVVYALFVDAAGGLWVGTRAGLSFLPPRSESFRTYTSRQGLANDVIYGIRSDEAGRLWLSTNNGLSMFEPRRGTFKNYRASHGLQANEFNFGASYRSPTGELFFGGNNGFNGFFPERLAHNETAPPVVLTRVTKNYSPLDGPADQVSRVHLEFRDRIIVFEFAALDYTAPDRNRIAYKLEGFDQDWVETDSSQATYTQLKAGHYVFRVRGANNDGVWNQNGLSVAVDVDAAPWATPWAWGAYLLVGCGCVAGAVRSQQRKVARQVAYGHLLEQRVQERTLELQKANEELAKASITDSLTGLANRRFLSEYVEKEISLLHRRYREIDRHGITQESLDIGFMMIDLDNFKSINDSSGHSAGDEVLRQLRDILRECCRESDIVIRWGGDEFLIVARDTDLERMGELAGRIRRRLSAHVFDIADAQTVHTTCSIGFACYPFNHECLDALSWEQVISVADRALYAAKASGRNAWVGISANDDTPVGGLFAAISSCAGNLVAEGKLNILTSLEGRPIIW
jgi:diguanylate cyclase (GGDEF)-like protein